MLVLWNKYKECKDQKLVETASKLKFVQVTSKYSNSFFKKILSIFIAVFHQNEKQ